MRCCPNCWERLPITPKDEKERRRKQLVKYLLHNPELKEIPEVRKYCRKVLKNVG